MLTSNQGQFHEGSVFQKVARMKEPRENSDLQRLAMVGVIAIPLPEAAREVGTTPTLCAVEGTLDRNSGLGDN